ncbi:MAG: hypothetical protein FD123_1994 [Bacteroidetes bacterium]|nr:MAG: hypothetical protein FD123_1994 [Bacteroidota bacterium]
MNQVTRNQSILSKYIPEPAVPVISEWIYHFNFKLKIKKSRSTKYGDYRPPLPGTNHQITINNDLNKYAFLITLVHEIAHLLCWERHRNNVKPHGPEWKESFKELMRPMMRLQIFPDDVRTAIIGYMQDPGASSCSDEQLTRVLRRYDEKTGVVLLEILPVHAVFIFGKNRRFVKGAKRRSRIACKELETGRDYLFSPLSEVIPAEMQPVVARESV